MNPYETKAMPELSADLYEQGVELARKMAAGGSGCGAISRKLRGIGIEEVYAEQVTREALMRQSRIVRLQGVAIFGGGMAIIALALMIPMFLPNFPSKLPVIVAMVGTFVTMIGGSKMVHRVQLEPTGRVPSDLK